ncbi:hypothetical protein TeGR_g1589 [Tetraparma gracilis]|uniref:Uncharacterized protein n=1 Tax=Tetraparma gracilis TaxID=2962635 RepID=A0ABQ6N2F9_9STRA|nr:hypothetical protein TeGR_g1589 [Tetraparma gracilis]
MSTQEAATQASSLHATSSSLLTIESEESVLAASALTFQASRDFTGPTPDAISRRESEAEFQAETHREIFGDEPQAPSARSALLGKIGESATIVLRTGGGELEAPLLPLASQSETVLAFLSSPSGAGYFSSPSPPRPSFDLSPHPPSAAALLVELLSSPLPTPSDHSIPPSAVIPLLELAHYLSVPPLLSLLSSIIIPSVDASNATSIAYLADKLSLPALFEAAMLRVSESLADLSETPQWSDIPPELQRRMLAMRAAAASSVLGKGSRGRVFFGSAEEFLAIVHDSLTEQRERLRAAKARHREVREERGGRWSGGGSAVEYEGERIGAQERRIETLGAFYEEQKRLFRGVGDGDFVLG